MIRETLAAALFLSLLAPALSTAQQVFIPYTADVEETVVAPEGEQTEARVQYRDSSGRFREDYLRGDEAWMSIIADPVDWEMITLMHSERGGGAMILSIPEREPPRSARDFFLVTGELVEEEELGVRIIEGLAAHGTRFYFWSEVGTNTINIWISKRLMMLLEYDAETVMSDGVVWSTYKRVFNIELEEPDPALFEIPEGYTASRVRILPEAER